ncbi:YjbF family lipoprotein [Alishewanella sp. 16-MA]|uniref:YjbF family lipoprotein n=1 Tax=Alishewanella maricola TaxID=2795740 RepID=A0ABS8C146_9ALTE|nr:YjbF family lipoprotein [Alishewanella maricola]MCB5226049.1 YjbF family lipoprotein [Alishewanella maricola]
MVLYKNLLVMCAIVFLTACSGTYRTYVEMFELALKPKPDAVLSFSELTSDNPDYLYAKLGDQPRSVMGLLFIEQDQFKWTSANQVILVTEQGRVVRTAGLENDLVYTSNTIADPVKTGAFANTSWGRMLDWEAGEYGYVVKSNFTVTENQFLTFFGQKVKVRKVVETLNYDNPSVYWRFDGVWQNVFWFDQASGKLLQSHQQLAPGMQPLELVFISEVARQLRKSGAQIAGDAI